MPGPPAPAPGVATRAGGPDAAGPTLRFGVDTFAFRNDSRIHHRGQRDLWANWCLVMARAVVQFQRGARFEPGAPPPSAEGCAALVRRITSRAPWRAPLAPARRVPVPGFGSLHELSGAEEATVKAGLHGRLRSLLHWTNWRIAVPLPAGHQPRVAAETMREIAAGRPVQLFVTDFPGGLALNHSLLAFAYRVRDAETVDFSVYDPNDPGAPGTIRYDGGARRFRPVALCGVDVPVFRAFRLYCSPLV